MRNVVLVGLPGSGKTTLGARLATALGRPFIDLDAEVERRAGMTVAEIFERRGEGAFRELESEAAAWAAAQRGVVTATGGGTLLRRENAEALAKSGFIVFIDRPVAAIAGDIETAGRPLLRQAGALEKLATQRRAVYLACADHVLDNSAGLAAAEAALLAACRAGAAPDYAVIGDPVGHSLSPAIHNAVFARLGVDACYGAVQVPRGGLEAFVQEARVCGLRGFNVTIPHKQDILPLLDEVDEGARRCGAVNTVVLRGGRLAGYNTDMDGLALALEHAGHPMRGRRVLVLGAGGAARAAALKAGLEGAAGLRVCARSPQKAEALARHVAEATGVAAAGGGFGPGALAEAAAESDLLVNGTPLGMQGVAEDFEMLDFLERLAPGAAVCDMVYKPAQTRLLEKARALGLAAQNGLAMLVYQALRAQELFLGRRLDMDTLYEAAVAAVPQGGGNKEDGQ